MKQTILLLLISGLFHVSCAAQNTSDGENYTKIKAEKFVRINEIKTQNLAPGIYETEGFVIKIYTCPKCPPDTLCKPCMKDNIVASEENKNLDSYDLSNKEIIIFTNQTELFEKGNKYLFKIKITDKKSTSEPINDIELLGSKTSAH